MSTDFHHLEFEYVNEHVLVVTIDKPDDPLNTVDEQLHHDLTALFPRLQAETKARAIVLTGKGRGFSAGGDFDWFPTLQDGAKLEALRVDAKNMIWNMLDVHTPIITALNGHAMGLGASLALLSDMIVMADTALIGDPHVKVGLVAGDGGTVIWPLAVGPALAKQYLLTGDPVTAPDALRMGLVNDVVPADECLGRALELANKVAANPPLAVRFTKVAVNNALKQQALATFDVASAFEMRTFQSADHLEALAALAEKRDPKFTGT